MTPNRCIAKRHAVHMFTVTETIHSYGGLAATHELLRCGFSKKGLSRAVHLGIINRVRQGWYCTPDVSPVLQQGIRVGGRLGCISAAALHGMWLPPDENLHVSLDHNECRLRAPDNMKHRLATSSRAVTTHWNTAERPGSRLLLDPMSCLAEVARCQSVEYAVAVADSGMRWTPSREPVISRTDWLVVTNDVKTRSHLLRLADGVCESGTESIAWVRLARHRLPIQRQVWIDGKRVDFLIGRRLVVEVDGAAYHVDPIRFEADRSRDAELRAMNYIVLRFSYNQVIYRWAEIERAVLAAVAYGDHL